jgi:hypothetical protein
MKALALTIALWVLAVTQARAESYETYAFGDNETDACEQAKTDLTDQAILQCRMSGGALKNADIGDCQVTASSNSRYKAVRSVKFSCQ